MDTETTFPLRRSPRWGQPSTDATFRPLPTDEGVGRRLSRVVVCKRAASLQGSTSLVSKACRSGWRRSRS